MKLLFVVLLYVSLSLAQTPAQRAQALLAKMTAAEKFAMVHGTGNGPYVGDTPANSRLGIPAINLEDGPQGVADGVRQVTAWPSALTVTASWDPEVMYAFSQGMAIEQRLKGTNVLLGPMMNLARVPFGGRNFEGLGEDPALAAAMASANVKGIQDQGVIACAKHWVNNNQEYHRFTVSADVDERSQWELYYPAFQAAVDAGAGSFMCSYNRINDTYACENEQTLGDLKKKMGFKGWIMSDWGATHSTVKAALAGLDQEMPGGTYFGTPLQNAVQSGQVPQSRVDDMVLRMLTSMYQVGLFDSKQPTGNLNVNATSPAHNTLARQIAQNTTVLLKNNGILPIGKNVKTIAVIGDDAQKSPIATGGGSGGVVLPYMITPLQGIKTRANDLQVSYSESNPVSAAATAAKNADLAIVFVSCTSSEGSDRSTLALPNGQDALVAAVVAAQPNTVVVLHHPGAVLMPWADSVHAIVAAFLPGQENGNAIASILFGDVNPSGKLPVTFPTSDKSIPVSTQAQYPGINDEATYSEKLLVGYRWYDQTNVAPLFPFGHGLSYSKWEYANPKVTGTNPATVSVDVTNVGEVSGAEVVQLYLGFPASAGEPPQILRRFKKVTIDAGKTVTVTFEPLVSRDYSFWDVSSSAWKIATGTHTIFLGSSSRDIRQKIQVNV